MRTRSSNGNLRATTTTQFPALFMERWATGGLVKATRKKRSYNAFNNFFSNFDSRLLLANDRGISFVNFKS